MTRICLVVLCLSLGACADEAPQTMTQWMTAATQCKLEATKSITPPICREHEVRFMHQSELPAPCNGPRYLGCLLEQHEGPATVVFTIEGMDLPGRTVFDDKIIDVYVHELFHLQLSCAIGDNDAGHTLDMWQTYVPEQRHKAKAASDEAHCDEI